MSNLNANYLSNVPLFHKKCGHQVYLDMTQFYYFIAIPSLRNDALVIEVSDFIQKPTQTTPSEEIFTCLCCEEHVSATDLLSTCGICFGTHPVEKLFRVKDSGGLYICEQCQVEDNIEINPRTSVLTAIKKYNHS